MSIIDDIFGGKSKTKVDNTTTNSQTVNPVPQPSFAGPLADIGTRAGDLLNADPRDFVAGLSDTQGRGIYNIQQMAVDPSYNNLMHEAYTRTSDPTITNSLSSRPGAEFLSGTPGASVTAQQIGDIGTVNAPALNTSYNAERVGTNDVGTNDILSRMSPFIQGVMQPALQQFDLQAGISSGQQRARLAGQRAFGGGGERAALMQDYLSNLSRQSTVNNLLQTGYNSASGLAETDVARQLQAALGNQSTSLGEQGLDADTAKALAQMTMQGQIANQSTSLSRQQSNQQAALSAGQSNQSLIAQLLQMQQQGLVSAGQLQQGSAAQMGSLAGQDISTNLGINQATLGAGQIQYDINQRQLQSPFTQLSNIANIVYGSPMGQSGTSVVNQKGTTTGTTTPSLFDIGTGIAKAAVGAGAFAHGGLVPGYADGGAVPSAWHRRFNNQHRYADGGLVDDDATQDDDLQALFSSANNNPAPIDQTEYIPANRDPQALSNEASSSPALSPTYSPPPQQAPASAARSASDMVAAAASQPRKSFGSRVRDFLNNDDVIGGFAMFSPAWARVRDEKLATSMAQTKMLFDLRMEAWKADQAKNLELMKEGAELKKVGLEHPYNSELMGLTGAGGQGGPGAPALGGNAPPGLIYGENEDAQLQNALTMGAYYQRQGKPIPPQLQDKIDMAHAKFGRLVPTQLPDGRTVFIPQMDLSTYPKPRGPGGGQNQPALGQMPPQRATTGPANNAGPALGPSQDRPAGLPPGAIISNIDKPLETPQAASQANVEGAKHDIDTAVQELFENGDIENGKVNKSALLIGRNTPNWTPFTDKSHETVTALSRAYDVFKTLQRAQGATGELGQERKENYLPSAFDGEEEIRAKVKRLRNFIYNTSTLSKTSRSGRADGAPALTRSLPSRAYNAKTKQWATRVGKKWQIEAPAQP